MRAFAHRSVPRPPTSSSIIQPPPLGPRKSRGSAEQGGSTRHEIHAPIILGAGDPPTDDGSVAVDVDVLDREPDGGVGGQSLSAREAFVVAGPSAAVGFRASALHHAVGGDEVDEFVGCPFEERGVY